MLNLANISDKTYCLSTGNRECELLDIVLSPGILALNKEISEKQERVVREMILNCPDILDLDN